MNYIQLDRRMVALILIELLARNFLVTQAINTRSMLITNWAQKWISSLNSSSSAIKKNGPAPAASDNELNGAMAGINHFCLKVSQQCANMPLPMFAIIKLCFWPNVSQDAFVSGIVYI